jgi:hypothetical protein
VSLARVGTDCVCAEGVAQIVEAEFAQLAQVPRLGSLLGLDLYGSRDWRRRLGSREPHLGRYF